MNSQARLTVKPMGGALSTTVARDGLKDRDTSKQRPEVKWEPAAMDRQKDLQVQRSQGGTLKEQSRRERCGSR